MCSIYIVNTDTINFLSNLSKIYDYKHNKHLSVYDKLVIFNNHVSKELEDYEKHLNNAKNEVDTIRFAEEVDVNAIKTKYFIPHFDNVKDIGAFYNKKTIFNKDITNIRKKYTKQKEDEIINDEECFNIIFSETYKRNEEFELSVSDLIIDKVKYLKINEDENKEIQEKCNTINKRIIDINISVLKKYEYVNNLDKVRKKLNSDFKNLKISLRKYAVLNKMTRDIKKENIVFVIGDVKEREKEVKEKCVIDPNKSWLLQTCVKAYHFYK